MTRVAVVGASGYAGAELVRILAGHPHVSLSVLTSRQHAGRRFDEIYPAFLGLVEGTCRDNDVEAICNNSEVVFLALPHSVSMEMVPTLLAAGKRVIDLSADFRFSSAAVYERHYQPHACPDLLTEAVYGLCEVNAEVVAAADLVGNPGCYPTSVLLPLLPLVRERLVDPSGMIADCKSGISGAGRSATQTTHYCHVNESFKPYKVGRHRHTPEMVEKLSAAAGRPAAITFVPHLLPMTRGMQSTIYVTPSPGVDDRQVADCLETYYRQKPFVRLLPAGRVVDTLQVKGTNFCDIAWTTDPNSGKLILLSAIDNLVKGAAGQAVQNMNLMLGLDERAGLIPMPHPL